MQPNADISVQSHARQLAETATVEIIPMRSATERLAMLPATTTVTVTCSPKLGIDATLELASVAVAAGHRTVPHLAARQLSDEKELHGVIERLSQIGIRDIFVIGGDASTPIGEFASSADLLEALAHSGHEFDSVGVGCYPEGHSTIPSDALVPDLLRKQQYATYMVSQLCFSGDALARWLRGIRADGVKLPLRLGIAAPVKTRKLVELSLKIGVGSSLKFLTKQKGIIGNLLVGNSYRPEHLLEELGGDLSSPVLDIQGLHVFSFNQIEETLAWQRRSSRQF